MRALLTAERYRVQAAESIDALLGELTLAIRPAVLVIDEDDAGPGWRDRLGSVPEDIPRVVLTWYPRAVVSLPVRAVGKPFGARELLDAITDAISHAAEPRVVR